jgi:hypothetical protein
MKITSFAIRPSRFYAKALLVCALAVLASASLMSATASAISGKKCAYTEDVSPGAQVSVCINIGDHNGDHVTDAWPVLTFYSNSGQDNGRPISGGIYMYQCSGTGSGCTAIAANQQNGPAFSRFLDSSLGGWDYSLETSQKPWSFGHTYKACGKLVTSTGFKVPTSASLMCTPLLAGS